MQLTWPMDIRRAPIHQAGVGGSEHFGPFPARIQTAISSSGAGEAAGSRGIAAATGQLATSPFPARICIASSSSSGDAVPEGVPFPARIRTASSSSGAGDAARSLGVAVATVQLPTSPFPGRICIGSLSSGGGAVPESGPATCPFPTRIAPSSFARDAIDLALDGENVAADCVALGSQPEADMSQSSASDTIAASLSEMLPSTDRTKSDKLHIDHGQDQLPIRSPRVEPCDLLPIFMQHRSAADLVASPVTDHADSNHRLLHVARWQVMSTEQGLAALGYSSLRPAQKPLVDAMLQGLDLLAVMQTGGGKNIVFHVASSACRADGGRAVAFDRPHVRAVCCTHQARSARVLPWRHQSARPQSIAERCKR